MSVTAAPVAAGAVPTTTLGRLAAAPATLLRRVISRGDRPRPPEPADVAAGTPTGRGPVVLVGGFCTTEAMLRPLGDWLDGLGYDVFLHTADMGLDCATRSIGSLTDTLRHAAALDTYGDGVRIVGYSRGGQFARALTHSPAVHDDGLRIRGLVTLGAPFDLNGGRLPVLASIAVIAAIGTVGGAGLMSLRCVFGTCCRVFRTRLRSPVPVPFTSIYSRTDELVHWRASRDTAAVNVEVQTGHLGLLHAADARHALAVALAA